MIFAATGLALIALNRETRSLPIVFVIRSSSALSKAWCARAATLPGSPLSNIRSGENGSNCSTIPRPRDPHGDHFRST
jgi:hypothetical protein